MAVAPAPTQPLAAGTALTGRGRRLLLRRVLLPHSRFGPRIGQANVWRWVEQILPLLTEDDPLGVDSFAAHHVPLSDAPAAYEMFQKKQDGAVKVLFQP